MTHCGQLFEKLDKLLNEKMTIDDIGEKLCDTVNYPRKKAIGLIATHKGTEFLKENADWLGYRIDKAKGDKAKGGLARPEKMSVEKSLHSNPIVPISTISIASVTSEVTVSDKVVKDTPPKIGILPKAEKIATIPPKPGVIIKENEEVRRDEITVRLVSAPYTVNDYFIDDYFIDICLVEDASRVLRLQLDETLWEALKKAIQAKNLETDDDLEYLKGKVVTIKGFYNLSIKSHSEIDIRFIN